MDLNSDARDDFNYFRPLQEKEAIATSTSQRGVSLSMLGELPQPAQAALGLILRRFAGLSFKLEHLAKAAEGRRTAAALRAAVPALLRHGYLVTACNAWGERLFFISEELLGALQELWITPRLTPIDGRQVKLVKEARRGLAWDLFRSLVWIARCGMPVTAKGTIHQRALEKLSRQIALQPGDVAGLSLKYPDAGPLPSSIAVVLDLLLDLGLIVQAPKAWQLSVPELFFWLKRDWCGMNAELFRRIRLKYVPAEAGMQHFVHALSSPGIAEGEWYSFEMLLRWLQQERLLRADLNEADLGWLWGWMEAMCGFGWVELGLADGGIRAFRWLEMPNRTEEELAEGIAAPAASSGHSRHLSRYGFYVQPDFEIMVPPEIPFTVRWELEAFAESVAVDRMSIYRITRDSLALGIQLGGSWKEMLLFLQQCPSGVPANVATAIEEWGRQLGGPQEGRRFPRLDASEPVNSMFIDSHPSADGRYAAKHPALEAARGRRGWIFCGEDRADYRLSDATPGKDELFPGLEQVPVMWLKTARGYHPSTARQIVSQAICWQTMLALRIGGEMLEYLPVGLEEKQGLREGSGWQITGKLFSPGHPEGSDTVLAPENWETMRLILPEADIGHKG